MPLQPVKDIKEYKRVKEALRDRDEAEWTGDQDLFRQQTKILQPLINTHQQSVKAIKECQEVNIKALEPLTRELQRRNDQAAAAALLAEQPLPTITQASPGVININLDSNLDETDVKNLKDMSFELPSVVFKNKAIEETLEKIKTENRSIGQKLGKGPVGQKVTTKDKDIYSSRKKTLENCK